MYRLIIADDELLVQIGIKSLLNWEQEDIVIAGMASNGQQAYEMIEKEQADIVITDIKMPVMDGMELITKCQSMLNKPPQFILLTSHEEFSLAREALQLGVVDYLIKLDLGVDNILKAINTAKARIQDQGQSEHKELDSEIDIKIQKLFKRAVNRLMEEGTLWKQMNEIDPDMTGGLCLLCFDIHMNNRQNLIRSEEERLCQCVEDTVHEIISKDFLVYEIPVHADRFFTLISTASITHIKDLHSKVMNLVDRIIKVSSEYYNVHLKIGCSSFNHPVEELALIYDEARQALRYVDGEKRIIFFDEVDVQDEKSRFDITIFSQQIIDAWNQQNVRQIQTAFSDMVDLFKDSQGSMEQIKDCCYRLLYFILTSLDDGESILQRATGGDASGFEYIGKIHDRETALKFISSLSMAICEALESLNSDYSMRLVLKAKKYVEENLEKRLSLSDTAAYMEINASYLSSIFKKHSGVGFANYVNQEKVKQAKKLLTENKYKIYEVADRMGFENAYYFSKIFGKYAGMTPKEYVIKNTKTIADQ